MIVFLQKKTKTEFYSEDKKTFTDTFFELFFLNNVCCFLNNKLKRCFYMGGRALFAVSERLLATGCLFWALQAELHNHPARNRLPFLGMAS